ncbi:MAG: hypothetical protein J7K59_04470 [Candidatus Korarchaeota archaeon]|nr:hypothetical protein [Candidatus Korarchaeota archaeon]
MSSEGKIRVKSIEEAEFRTRAGLPLAAWRYKEFLMKKRGISEDEAISMALNYFISTFKAYSSLTLEELEEMIAVYSEIAEAYKACKRILQEFAERLRNRSL